MVRATWVKPMTLVQKFEANEAVTACLQIVCQSDTYCSGQIHHGEDHSPADDSPKWETGEDYKSSAMYNAHSACKTPSNNSFSFDTGVAVFTGDGGIDSIIDASNDGIYGNEDDRVYWHSTVPNRVMFWDVYVKLNHWGTVEKSSNRS